jgi:voltage-gated potassium channel
MARNWQRVLVARLEPRSRAVLRAIVFLVLAGTLVFAAMAALATVPNIPADQRAWLDGARLAAAIVLSVEFAIRVLRAGAADTLWHYLRSIRGLVDLVPVLCFWIEYGFVGPSAWLDGVQLLVLLKLGRLAPGIELIATVLYNERRALFAGFISLVILLVLASTLMYLAERHAQPGVFASIPDSLWWGVVTVSTVGYGDMVPVTAFGRFLGGFMILLGIAVIAVPTGILATGFAAELRKRDFIVTWQMVAKVPLFANLDAVRISAIARLLRPQAVPANSVIVRHGERADAIFFVTDGEAEVEVTPHPVRLTSGDFFGEIALIKESPRVATVIALTDCRLLTLDVGDFRRLLESDPEIAAKVAAVAEQRLAELGGATPATSP